jgi:hypothetical protein
MKNKIDDSQEIERANKEAKVITDKIDEQMSKLVKCATDKEAMKVADKVDEQILEFIRTASPDSKRVLEIANEYNEAKEKLSVDDFALKDLDKEGRSKLDEEIKEAIEVQKMLDKLDPCSDLHVCEIAAKHMALELDGPETKQLYFLIGEKNTQKLKALGYKLFRGDIDVELLSTTKSSLSTDEKEMLKWAIKMFQDGKVDFEMLQELLK